MTAPDFSHQFAGHQPRKLRKRAARIHCEDLSSNFGPVLDLSLSGARILYRGIRRFSTGQQLTLTFRGYGCEVAVRARLARARRLGFMAQELGLQFYDVDAGMKRTISDLVRTHSVRYHVFKDAA
ncbi:MAG: PilZ domain-containing protein [Planctomycetota bacterium]|nr:MAG: PilZ domain-containing protein [Planctomycetota bacterium]